MENDKVWLKYVHHTPALIEVSEGNPIKVQCRNDTCLVEVDKEFVPVALSKSCSCNCGSESTKKCFVLATEDEIRRFNE